LKTEYAKIHARVADADKATPNPLRSALTELFVNHPAVRPHDICDPATAKMIRYKLANGKSLGHQIETKPQHLWFAAGEPMPTIPAGETRLYPVTAGGKGRHSNVNQMPDLRDKAVARVTVRTVEEAKTLLNGLLA
jgi:hypothetical protein